jgi:hypothetical protein
MSCWIRERRALMQGNVLGQARQHLGLPGLQGHIPLGINHERADHLAVDLERQGDGRVALASLLGSGARGRLLRHGPGEDRRTCAQCLGRRAAAVQGERRIIQAAESASGMGDR